MKHVTRLGLVAVFVLCGALGTSGAQGLLPGPEEGVPEIVPKEVRGEVRYHKIVPRHIWAGEIAQLIGGTVIEPRFQFMAMGTGTNALGGGGNVGGYGQNPYGTGASPFTGLLGAAQFGQGVGTRPGGVFGGNPLGARNQRQGAVFDAR